MRAKGEMWVDGGFTGMGVVCLFCCYVFFSMFFRVFCEYLCECRRRKRRERNMWTRHVRAGERGESARQASEGSTKAPVASSRRQECIGEVGGPVCRGVSAVSRRPAVAVPRHPLAITQYLPQSTPRREACTGDAGDSPRKWPGMACRGSAIGSEMGGAWGKTR